MGSHFFGDSEIQILAPKTDNSDLYHLDLSANDNSMVLRIIHGQTALLWPGDIEDVGEKLLVKSAANISAQILKAPHHGSKTSSTEDFIKSVNPKHVIFSTGRDNHFKFPHDVIVKRYKKYGAKQWNLATAGQVTIKVSNTGFSIDAHIKPFQEKT